MNRLLTTGDADLDRILGGGLSPGSLVVVAGPPGSGKTILAQQICFANATTERPALFYTTWSEPHDKLVRHLSPFEFFDAAALGHRVEFLHLADLVRDGIGAAADEIIRRSIGSSPAVVVIDSSKALHDVVSAEELRRAIYDLASKVSHSGAVLVLVGEYTRDDTRHEPEFAIADTIVELENEPRGPVDRRWLRVLKMRGAELIPGQHSFRLGGRGFEVFPRLETTLPGTLPASDGRTSLGVDRLDALVGGGLPSGDVTLIVGPSGVGKTLLSLHFVAAGLAAGEQCLYVSFQESPEQLRTKAAAAGIEWEAYGERLSVLHMVPVELDLDEVGSRVRAELGRGKVTRVVVDSLAELEFAARETDRFPAYVWALGGFARAAGATTLITNEMAALGQSGGLGGLSFLFNNVIFLRYVEMDSQLRRGINVLKMRESDHAKGLVEFTIGGKGIEVGQPIESVTGLLGWSALHGER